MSILIFGVVKYVVYVTTLKVAFHLQKIFRGQERNGKFSAEWNGKFSVVNFHFFSGALFQIRK